MTLHRATGAAAAASTDRVKRTQAAQRALAEAEERHRGGSLDLLRNLVLTMV